MAYRPASLLTVGTITPTAAGSVGLASRFLLSDATYATGMQLQSLFGSITVATAASALTGLPGSGTVGVPVTGITTALAPAGSTAYAVLYSGGADVGVRVAFSGAALPSLTPVSAGFTTVRVYGMANGGVALVESAAFSVMTPAVVPGPVTALTAGAATSTTIAVNYTPPASGSAVSSYSGRSSLDGTTWTASGGTFGASGGVFTGLSAGTAYHLAIVAANTAGSSTTVFGSVVSTGAASAISNAYQVNWYGAPPTSTFAPTGSYNGYKYGTPESDTYFKLTSTSGSVDLANTTGVLHAWIPSATTSPVAGGPTGAGLNAANYANGYVTAVAAAAPYYHDSAVVAAVSGTPAQTVYFWVSADGGSSWSLWRDGSNNPIGVTVSF